MRLLFLYNLLIADAYSLKIPLTRSTFPARLRRVEVEVWVTGHYYQRSFAPLPSQATQFVWDGKDVYGRTVQGRQPVTVTTTFVYGARYLAPVDAQRAFGRFGGSSLFTNRDGGLARAEFRFPHTWRGAIGTWLAVETRFRILHDELRRTGAGNRTAYPSARKVAEPLGHLFCMFFLAPLGLSAVFRYYSVVNFSQNKVLIDVIIPARD